MPDKIMYLVQAESPDAVQQVLSAEISALKEILTIEKLSDKPVSFLGLAPRNS